MNHGQGKISGRDFPRVVVTFWIDVRGVVRPRMNLAAWPLILQNNLLYHDRDRLE